MDPISRVRFCVLLEKEYKKFYGQTTNEYQSTCLNLLKLWLEKSVDEQYKRSLSAKQYITEFRELIIYSGRQVGATTLLKAIQDAYPSDVVIGVPVKQSVKVHNFLKDASFSLDLLRRATAGTTETKK